MISGLLVVLSYVAWYVVKAEDVCHLSNPKALYCYCDEKMAQVSCMIFSATSPTSSEWDIFGSRSTITEVDLKLRHDGSLTFVPTKIFKSALSLEVFRIKDADLSTIESMTFVAIPSLTILDLEKNGVQILEPQSFLNLSNLREIHLHGNQLTNLSADVFVGCGNVSFLDLSSNQIDTLADGSLTQLRSLQTLDASSNKIKRISNHPFQGLNHLESLNLSYNLLETIPSHILSDLNRLRILDLSHNRIKFIRPGALHSLSQLEDLRLFDNKLVVLSSDVFKATVHLQHLDLGHNVLKHLTDQIVSPFKQELQKGSLNISLEGNLLACDCHLKWLHLLLDKSPPLKNVTCYFYHGEMANFDKEISVVTIDREKLTCPKSNPQVRERECPQALANGVDTASILSALILLGVISLVI